MRSRNEVRHHHEAGPVCRLLLIDDDPDLGGLLRDYLGRYGLNVTTASSGTAGLERVRRGLVDLVILDVKLPDVDGFELLRQIRQYSGVPVIMLTGLDDSADRVVGLEMGADDYVTKPFEPRELLARIRAVLRRCRGATPVRVREYRFAGYRLLPDERLLITPEGERRRLSRSEQRLLRVFLEHPGRLLTRERLLELCHPHGEEVFDRAVDVQVLRLRRKLGDGGRLIVTERGAGYRFTGTVTRVG